MLHIVLKQGCTGDLFGNSQLKGSSNHTRLATSAWRLYSLPGDCRDDQCPSFGWSTTLGGWSCILKPAGEHEATYRCWSEICPKMSSVLFLYENVTPAGLTRCSSVMSNVVLFSSDLCLQYWAAVSGAEQPAALQGVHTPFVFPPLQQGYDPQTCKETFRCTCGECVFFRFYLC